MAWVILFPYVSAQVKPLFLETDARKHGIYFLIISLQMRFSQAQSRFRRLNLTQKRRTPNLVLDMWPLVKTTDI